MGNYLEFLNQNISEKAFSRKSDYIKYNFRKYLNSEKPMSAEILEIGPGLGEAIKYLNEKGVKAIDVVDNDESVLNYIGKKYSVRKTLLADQLGSIEESLSEYDAIVAIQVLEHIPKSAHESFLRILFKHLKSGGRILITVPNMGNPFTSFERYGDITHETAFTDSALKQLCMKSDIPVSMIKVDGFRIPPYSIINVLRIFFQKIFQGIILGLSIMNGGSYTTLLTPNITLVVTKK